MAFIDSNQILYKSQYGFRKQMSTSLAIIELVEEITNSLDNHESTVGVFIDLKKAFDTVDHGICHEVPTAGNICCHWRAHSTGEFEVIYFWLVYQGKN